MTGNFDKSWTLFLDRDGVINKRIPGAYVQEWSAFEFLPGVLDALKIFNSIFGRIVVVTNQQGIGKGLMSTADLTVLHRRMLQTVEEKDGRIDRIYFCPDLANQPANCRKPAPTMALQAQKDFPEINFKRSLIIGDSFSDIQFGTKLGMQTLLIPSKAEDQVKIEQALANNPDFYLNYRFDSLIDFASFLKT